MQQISIMCKDDIMSAARGRPWLDREPEVGRLGELLLTSTQNLHYTVAPTPPPPTHGLSYAQGLCLVKFRHQTYLVGK